jgi:hypothetical protein
MAEIELYLDLQLPECGGETQGDPEDLPQLHGERSTTILRSTDTCRTSR